VKRKRERETVEGKSPEDGPAVYIYLEVLDPHIFKKRGRL
jgi:hypothetical protein